PSDLRRHCHKLRLDDILSDRLVLLRHFPLGFRLHEPKSFSALSIKNLREEVLVAVATENQTRLRIALAGNAIDVEVGRRVVVCAANNQCAGGVVGGQPVDSISARLSLFVANHEIEPDVCLDPAAEARKPDNRHGNDKGQCGYNAQYLLFQNYLHLVCAQRLLPFAAECYLHKMRCGIPSPECGASPTTITITLTATAVFQFRRFLMLL